MGTRKINRKSNKSFRKTRSKIQRGIVGGIKRNTTKSTKRITGIYPSVRMTYGHTPLRPAVSSRYKEEKQKHKIEMERTNSEITSRPKKIQSLFNLAADSLHPDVASKYNAESGVFGHVDLNPRERNIFGGKRKTRKTKRKPNRR
jgi:hypothetical protein